MSETSLAVAAKKRKAETIRRKLVALGILRTSMKVFSDDNYVYFPVERSPDPNELPELITGDAIVQEANFDKLAPKPKTLKEAMRSTLDEKLMELVPKSFDIIGSIAILELDEKLRPFAKDIASALKLIHKNVDTVLLKAGPSTGEYRTRPYEVIAGSGNTLTEHIEHGCRYRLDVREVFFTPRLSGERLRVASQVKPNECVADMFAGVGPFSITIAKMQPTCKVYAFEINPVAYRFLEENIRLNKVEGRVTAVFGDVRHNYGILEKKADRLIMNLPFSADKYLDVATKMAKPSGAVVHFYGAAKDEDAIERVKTNVESIVRSLGLDVKFLWAKELKEVAPRRVVVALDIAISTR
ncbi:MAG: class I SAM-dependent methyltransferase family protein [Nitrososphaerota archaeon]|nr:class I SAM-dependent methyltransferase family protein [Aigarchaeota archaeon]MDW8076224.1 class I SAM-dependent methyltransferase family protein [Nitrososphaerota archaeon]